MDLRYYDGGYYGYLNEEVRKAIGDTQATTNHIEVVDPATSTLAIDGLVVGQHGLSMIGEFIGGHMHLPTLPVYEDNASAAAVLAVGDVYRTSTGELRIRL